MKTIWEKNVVTLREIVNAAPELLDGVTLEDVQYFMDIAEQEGEWAVARRLKKIVEAQEALQKELEEEERALKEQAAKRMFFSDGFGGYVTFKVPDVILLEDYKRNDEGEWLRAQMQFTVDRSYWKSMLQEGRDGYAVNCEEAATARILKDLIGEGEMYPFFDEDYQPMQKRA